MSVGLSVGLKQEQHQPLVEFTANLLKLQSFYYVKSMFGKQTFCAALSARATDTGILSGQTGFDDWVMLTTGHAKQRAQCVSAPRHVGAAGRRP